MAWEWNLEAKKGDTLPIVRTLGDDQAYCPVKRDIPGFLDHLSFRYGNPLVKITNFTVF